MYNKDLYNSIRNELIEKISLLEDKPEENIDSTIKALWLKASGKTLSVVKASNESLPELNEQQELKLKELIQLRMNNIPLAHITGRQDFMGIELLSDKRALIPRKETEILGKKALEISRITADSTDDTLVMDVCCGAGNLGLAIATYNPECFVYASDISQEAVELTQENIDFLFLGQRVEAVQGDMMSAFETDKYYEKFDLIVCNPPYIFSSNIPKMKDEISLNEPAVAFDGGMLGINIIKAFIREAPKFLKKAGWLAFEVGVGQGPLMRQLCERTLQFDEIETVADFLGNIRVVSARKI